MANDCGAANRERVVKRAAGTAIVLLAALVAATSARGQQPATPAAPAQNPLDVVPEKMPFNTPYGAPISLQKAEDAIRAAVAEANKRGWALNIAVFDSGGHLVSFARMGGGQLASIAISEHKARASAKFRRPTRFFEDAVQRDTAYPATLDDVVASRGGIPLIEDGKLVGAIGCSGGIGSQDEAVCSAGAATINK
jgi:glc operon protein GlcG